MPYQKKPSPTTQKPVNIFYVWYTELCRRLNSAPAPVVKPAKPKCQTVLNFVADRLKVEEWSPVINALRHDTSLHVIAIKSRLSNYQFLHEVDTEEKLRQMKRRTGSLWTAFILKSLLKSVSCTVRNTEVLTCLEFDGLPIFAEYLEPLMKALQKNKTLKNLSLSRCRICDPGCQIVCAYVRFAPNIEVLNLSGCGLTTESGEHLAKLIKYQQINRYCESWHNSLRYSDPNIQVMRGIKRITLNGNPMIGDDGLNFILNELDDDLWIKALDMQKCGITENMGMRIVDLVGYSQSLEIVDFRLNENLADSTIERIFSILKQKHIDGQSEYQWYNSSFTTNCESFLDSVSAYTSVKTPQVYKAKSAPVRAYDSKMTVIGRPVRRAKTSANIPNQNTQDSSIEQKVMELSSLLNEEILKRKETEKLNEELKRRLDQFNHVQVEVKPKPKVEVVNNVRESTPIEMLNKICRKNGVKKKNGVKTNGFRENNGYQLNGDLACTIFEKLVGRENGNEKDEESLLNFAQGGEVQINRRENDCDMTDSQISLFKFMENLKSSHHTPVKFSNRPITSKYYLTDKYVKKK